MRPRLSAPTTERLEALAHQLAETLGTEVSIAQVIDLLAARCPSADALVRPGEWVDQNGPEWTVMVQDGPHTTQAQQPCGTKMDRNGPKWTGMDRNGPQRAGAPAREEELITARACGNNFRPRRDVLENNCTQSSTSTSATPTPPSTAPTPAREGARAGAREDLPLADICRAYGEACDAAGLSSLPPYLPADLVDELREAWVECPDLDSWLRALQRLPRCRETLAGVVKVGTLRGLLQERYRGAGRVLWRVLEGELDDDRTRQARVARLPDPSPSHRRSRDEIEAAARASGFEVIRWTAPGAATGGR